ncbi:Serine/threonine-protein kinase PknD [compost metagenome]
MKKRISITNTNKTSLNYLAGKLNLKAKVLLALSLLFASSCFKEKDTLMGVPVKVEVPPTPGQNNGDVAINYTSPLTLHLNEVTSAISPTIVGDIIPEVVQNYVTTLYGDDVAGTTNGPTPADVRFNAPMGIALDDKGVIYLVEDGRKLIRRILTTGDIRVSIFAGPDNAATGFTDGLGSAARFTTPLDLATHPISGDVYVVDGNRIRKITPDGDVTTFAGALNNTTGLVNGIPSASRFNYLAGIAIDKVGNIYVADRDNHCIRKYTAATNQFTTLAGTGGGATPTSGYKDDLGTAALFKSPVRVALDENDNVYVADRSNFRIRKITPAGLVTTFAGDGTNVYKEGNGTSAGFVDPYGLAVSKNGDVYVGDYNGNRVRKIAANRDVTTVAGDGIAGLADGIGSSAKVAQASGFTMGPNDNLYFLSRRGSIRMLALRGFSISPELPAGLKFDPFTGAISGTPTQTSTQSVYNVKAYNGRGEIVATTDIVLSVL